MVLFISKQFSPGDIKLPSYAVELPLERLRLGVDNLRYDVHISPEFVKEADALIFQLVLKHAAASPPLLTRGRIQWHQEISRFKNSCRELMIHAVNQAKSLQEIQIDYLAQVAIVKLLLGEIDVMYDAAVQHFKSVVRKQEVSRRTESHLELREEVGSIVQRRNTIVQEVGDELLSWFTEIHRELDEPRNSVFGEDGLLPAELFGNPLLQSVSRSDDYFMINHYVLLGHRIEDPLHYKTILSILIKFFARTTSAGAPQRVIAPPEEMTGYGNGFQVTPDKTVDRILKRVENMDALFNYPETEALIRAEKKENRDRKRIQSLRHQAGEQKTLLRHLYRTMAREKMLAGIVAAYGISPAVSTCCPPLTPQEVLQYVVVSKARKTIARKMARFNKYSAKTVFLHDLKKTAAAMRRVSTRQKRIFLIRFLRDFAAYHRDLGNYSLFRETADCINLARDEKIIRLSRENNTLYEFLLPSERTAHKTPILRHVIVKADVRGSTGIIDQMKEKGLNPASNFSLNFFDPISNLISQYGAEKVFIEGDAVILSISEHEGAPERWYGVARACGMAVNILMVVKRYNLQNRKNRLPRLDLGIGISFSPSAPTFFYDGDNPIMISPAINEADILSACDRVLRERFSKSRPPFNIYVHQIDTASLETAALLDSPILRYNVMGIELSEAGFKKLSEEIHLDPFEARIPEFQPEPFVAYTGKFPTVTGSYQRIIIREADIPEISPLDFQVLRLTGRKYYEVCTHAKIYDYVKRMK